MDISEFRPGILIKKHLEILRKKGHISCGDIDSCAIDLHLSDQCWPMKGSVKLNKKESFSTINANRKYADELISIKSGKVLESRKTYVIQLKEELKLGDLGCNIFGQATGKSSIGRLDVLTRLIVDNCEEFDTITEDYNGPLYVEVTPITFPIYVKEGSSLNQMRLFRGKPELSLLKQEEISLYGAVLNTDRDDYCDLTLNLEPTTVNNVNVIAFTTKETLFDKEKAIDLKKGDNDSIKTIDPTEYWEKVEHSSDNFIRIKSDRFYILRSKERFRLPKDVGVYCHAITENLGEIRIHYAGFVHPGFGLNNENGTPLIFEVRGHTVDAFLRDGQLMARVLFYRTSEPADVVEGEYDKQELKLSKYFDMEKWRD